MKSVKIKLTATADQIKSFERVCEMSEGLLGATLAKRIEGKSAEKALPFILDWFRSVRQFTVANHMMSGIKFEVEVNQPPVADGEPCVGGHSFQPFAGGWNCVICGRVKAQENEEREVVKGSIKVDKVEFSGAAEGEEENP